MVSRYHIAILLACTTLGIRAQVRVQVSDDVSGEAVPNAHVTCSLFDGSQGSTEVTDLNGNAILPLKSATLSLGVLVRITHIGFEPVVDTLWSGGQRTFYLKRALQPLDEVVITGQYAPGSPESAVHRIRVLDKSYFQRIAANNLAEGLRNELNIRLGQDNILGTSMSMQGMGGENVKILVDGVPVIGRLNGSIDLSQLDITGIERVEIVEGPLSVNYGTNALAGAINLITRKQDASPASLRSVVYMEHIGRLNTTVTGTRSWGANDLLVTFGRNYFGGWNPDVPVQFGPRHADTTRFQQWKPREQYSGRLRYGRQLGAWDLGYKAEVMRDLIINRGRPRAPYLETAFDEQYLTWRVDNAVFVERSIGKNGLVKALLAHNRYTRTRNTWFRDLTTLSEDLVSIDGLQDTSRFALTNLRAVCSNSRDGAMVQYELGVDINEESGAGDRMAEGTQWIGDRALFGSMEVRAWEHITLRPGLRYAWNTRYEAPLIPSLNLRWQLSQRYTLRASYARGFRAPSLKELYLYFVDVNHDIVGDPNLEAERSHHYSAALSARHPLWNGALRGELNLFHNDVQDLITLALVQGTRYTYVNIGSLRTWGGTLGLSWATDHWTIALGAGMTARSDEIVADDPQDVFWSPEATAAVTRTWGPGWTVSMNGKFQGRQANYVQLSNTEVERGYIEGMILADLSVARSIWQQRLRVSLGCKDLFDVQNVSASIAGGVHGSTGTSVPMTTGRTAFVRLDLSLARTDKR